MPQVRGLVSVPRGLARSGPPVLAFSPGAIEGPKQGVQGGQGPPSSKARPRTLEGLAEETGYVHCELPPLTPERKAATGPEQPAPGLCTAL